MRDDLKTLLELQELDLKIKAHEEEKAGIRRSLEELNEKIKAEEETLARLREEGKKETVQIKERELEAEEKRIQIDKYEKQLFQIKNNREYQALLDEIRGLKADIENIEDAALEVMEELEANRAGLKAEEERLSRDREKLRAREEEAVREIARIDAGIERLSSERQTLIPGVGQELFGKYCRIRDHKPGRALVPVVSQVCQGCDMRLTAQVNNDLYKEDCVLYCENCGRLIYLGKPPLSPPPAAE